MKRAYYDKASGRSRGRTGCGSRPSKCELSRRASRPPPVPLPTTTITSALTWLPQPEFAESVLILLEHVPHPEAAAVRPVPLRQLLVVGVAGERHDAAVRWFDLGQLSGGAPISGWADGLLCREEKGRSGWCY